MLQNAEEQTNLYALQKDGITINTTKKEIEILIGIYLRMGIVQMPRSRSYWEADTRYDLIAMERPTIIAEYNKFMGGVDLLDSLTSLYKRNVKSRRWYMYIFWHSIMIAVVNS
ncbi:hypothetical protein KUTeg_022276 [Tegillarca granosa]|uniref:PiggyBac transposable element-derived protein domain-containing protein n=1 Tax=Tegillarca granosa TaxID=220873 RepID=A0ABQ9E645_TEGGR|nr:hypothetical protein KUTeg_022276 [Tegillarca granosa]